MMEHSLITSILVPTDGSNPSLQAAHYAAQIARCTGASVMLLYVVQLSGVGEFVAYTISSTRDLPDDLRKSGTDIVEKTREVLDRMGVVANISIREGDPSRVIVSEAQEHRHDLIIVGSCGAGTGVMKRMFLGLGSVAERVVANAPCPVLVVRSVGKC